MDDILLLSHRNSQSPTATTISSILINVLLFLGSETPCQADIILCHPLCDCLDAFFDCTGRSITTFPPDFPIWINKLNVSNNEITSIGPYHLSRLIHLESLFLDGNNLTSVPTTSERLETLTQLTLSKNGISRIESMSLTPFTGLRELDLSRNRIDAIDNSSFPRDNQLNMLNLASNFLETLDSGGMSPLGSLTDLNLARNRIKFIAKDAFIPLTNLEKLDLSRNKLEMMDSLRFQELKKLQVLNLRRNHMGNLSDAAFYGLEKIQQLYLDWNNIRLVDKRWLYGLRSLRTLNLSHNQVSRIEDDSWEFMEQVQFLDLSFNQIQIISKKTLPGLSKLRTLDLSNNRIVEIQEDAFMSLDKLEVLDLSHNELSWVLEDVSTPFRGLKECHTLNLASNQIHTIHFDAFVGLGNLRFLNLSENPITWLSEKAFLPVPNVNLFLADIYSLVCDCEIQWLHLKLLQQQQTTTSRIRHDGSRVGMSKKLQSRTYCAFPLELANRNLLDLTLHDLSCSGKYKKPIFLEEPKTQVFLVEGNGTLTCHLESPPNIPVTVHWKKNHHDLSKELQSQIVTTDRVEADGRVEVISKLQLVNVSWSDSGRYQCIGQGLGVVYSKKANVTVHIFPSFIKKPANVTVRLGSNAKLECGAKGFPTPEIAFQKDGGEDFPAALERRFHVMPNDDSFFIMEVKLSDMGVYSCSAKNTAGEIRTFATVTVFETPSFRYGMEDESAVEGSNAILECLASGSPKPQILWSKEGVQITEAVDIRYYLTENGSLLVIKDVQVEDNGKYECLLTNAVGIARGIMTLTILPATGGKLGLDNATMTIIFIIIAVFCVVGTSAAWVVVIYTTRKRKKMTSGRVGGGNVSEEKPLRHKYDEYEGQSSSIASYPPLPPFQITKVVCGDSGSQSSSGKDSGNGEDLPESIVAVDGDDDSCSRGWMKRKHEMESFSTFGGTRAPSTARLSQTRLDLKPECDNSMISLTHTGKEFLSIPRRVPIPIPVVPPPPLTHPHVVCLHMDTIVPDPNLKSANSSQNPLPLSSSCSASRPLRSHSPESLKEAEDELDEANEEGIPEGRKMSVNASISTPV